MIQLASCFYLVFFYLRLKVLIFVAGQNYYDKI